MKSLINIEIKNSFNKKDDSLKNGEDIINNISTLNNHKNIAEISSMSLSSITASQFKDNFKIIDGEENKDKNGFWNQILIGAIGGAIGTIIGALATYFIFGIK